MYDVTDQAAGFTVIAVSLAWAGLVLTLWAGAGEHSALGTLEMVDGGNQFPATWPLVLVLVIMTLLHTQLPVTDLKIVKG